MSLVNTETGEMISTESLEELEEIIGQGLETFVAVGEALAKVRDSKLYLQHAETFEAYCKVRWNLQRTRAYELIEAASIASAVSEISDIAPKRESHAAALAPLKHQPEKMAEAMNEAAADAAARGGVITAADIREAVKKAEQKKQDREEIAALEAELQPEGFDPALDAALAEERGRLRRLCRDIASLPTPAELVEKQHDYLDRLRTTAEVADKAYAWLDGFLAEMEDHR